MKQSGGKCDTFHVCMKKYDIDPVFFCEKMNAEMLCVGCGGADGSLLFLIRLLKGGYRNPTGFRRWVKVAKSGG